MRTVRAELTGRLHVNADLDFRVELGGSGGSSSVTRGRVEADGSDVVVRFSRAPSLGGSSTRPLVGPLAQRLSEAGLTVYVSDPSGPVLKLGAGVRAPRWQRLGTGSTFIQLHSLAAYRRTLGGPKLFEAALPTALSLPDLDAVRSGASRGTDGQARQARNVLALGVRLWRRLTRRRR